MVESDIRGLIDPINKGEMFPYLFNIMNIVQPQGANHIFSQTPSWGVQIGYSMVTFVHISSAVTDSDLTKL